MNGVVVVDANLAIKWLVSEENSDKASRNLPLLGQCRNPGGSTISDAGRGDKCPASAGSAGRVDS